jgi:hypothetical protein
MYGLRVKGQGTVLTAFVLMYNVTNAAVAEFFMYSGKKFMVTEMCSGVILPSSIFYFVLYIMF